MQAPALAGKWQGSKRLLKHGWVLRSRLEYQPSGIAHHGVANVQAAACDMLASSCCVQSTYNAASVLRH
jgi:hypothetical protein